MHAGPLFEFLVVIINRSHRTYKFNEGMLTY